jgi:hypothetical protein
MKLPTIALVSLSALSFAAACSGAADENPSPDSEEVASVSQGIVTAQDVYKKNGVNSPDCNVDADILIKEPDGPGPFPVFVYTGGTGETGLNGSDFSASTESIVTEAARQGFVAAALDYEDSGSGLAGFGSFAIDAPTGRFTGLSCVSPFPLHRKTRCAYSTSFNPQSALSKLCGRAKAGCATHGIVTAGFSQGAVLAAVARNYDTRVRGTWALGFSDFDAQGFALPCLRQGAGALGATGVRLLSNNRIRLTNGINQFAFFTVLQDFLPSYNRMTGRNCSTTVTGGVPATTNCLNGPNTSGWKLALGTTPPGFTPEVTPPNPAQHCFLTISTNGFDCTSPNPDPVFAAIPPAANFASGMFQNISWLKNSIVPLGNQP